MSNDYDRAQAEGIVPWSDLAWENDDVIVFRDGFPVTWGHLLFVPKRLDQDCLLLCFKEALDHGDKMVENHLCQAYNVGINQGKAAGQTVRYPHVHMIPRRYGDTADPVGGVRHVVEGQGNYHSDSYKIPR